MRHTRTPPPHLLFFFFNDTATTEIYTLSLHDALPISERPRLPRQPSGDRDPRPHRRKAVDRSQPRSEEHTSELQSPCNLVCRLLLEKKKNEKIRAIPAHLKKSLRCASSSAAPESVKH